MALLRREGVLLIPLIKDTKNPAVLAEKLAKSQEKRDNQIADAKAQHAAVRANVIETAAERISQIQVLQHELEQESKALNNVVDNAAASN